MTRKERLMTIFRGGIPDRPAVKLWGAKAGNELLHPAYAPVREAAMELTDLMDDWNHPFNIYCGKCSSEKVKSHSEPTGSPDWIDIVTEVKTPDGILKAVFQKSTLKKPGYQKEHLLKEPDDIKKLLALPYEPFDYDFTGFQQRERQIGDAGIVMFIIDHAMYALERQIGSENFALWSMECRALLLEAITIYADRLQRHVKKVFESGIKPVFCWVGPELCIPPLMSPADFEEFVFNIDKPLIDMIHDNSGYAWVHSHGKMKGPIKRFMEMGVDVLNPIEPPPMGDITVEEAFTAVGNRMGLEGGIETHDIMSAQEKVLTEKIRSALDAGNGKRFILCPSSGYMENPEPDKFFINNLLLYVKEGTRYAGKIAEKT